MMRTQRTCDCYPLFSLLIWVSFSLRLTEETERSLMPAPCVTGYFPCNSSDFCVEQRFQCDGVEDCYDGSDETKCKDRQKQEYWDNLYQKRPDEDREKKLAEGCLMAFHPEKCSCSAFSVFCEQLELRFIPSNIHGETTDLDLSGNRLTKLKEGDFLYLNKLETLILTSSVIKEIEGEAFINLPALRSLYLSGNDITRVLNNTFLRNKHLSLLRLSHNKLHSLEDKSFEGLHSLNELDLRDCRIKELPNHVFDSLVELKILLLDGNLIGHLPKSLFGKLRNLEILSLTRNHIPSLSGGSFQGLQSLKSLSLSINQLHHLSESSFTNLTSLLKLDIRQNSLHNLDVNLFQSLEKLESLDLRKNPLKKLPEAIFWNLSSLTNIYFDEFHFCSYSLHVRICEPKGDGISSFQHLLDNVVLRVSVWFVAVMACVGNIFVIIGQMLIHETNEIHSFFIKNLAFADLIMGVYLFIIAYYDVHFRGEYIKYEMSWRQSWQCNFSGFLSTLSSESSVFILAVITVDRYSSVIHPFSLKRRRKSLAVLCMGTVWTVAIFLAILPLVYSTKFGEEFYGNNGVCLPLKIHDPYSAAWEYSTFLFCVLNSLAFLFIAYAYIAMSIKISSSRLGLRTTQQKNDRSIAKRFAFIVITDFFSWIPIVIIKILALSGAQINDELYAWVAVFVLPVNSALNPVLYSLTTKLFKERISNVLSMRFRATKAGSDGHDNYFERSQLGIKDIHSHSKSDGGSQGTSQNEVVNEFKEEFREKSSVNQEDKDMEEVNKALNTFLSPLIGQIKWKKKSKTFSSKRKIIYSDESLTTHNPQPV